MDISSLQRIVTSTVHRNNPLPGYDGSTLGLYGRSTLGVDCDEVYSNLFVGDIGTAKSKVYLQHVGITHVLNAAEGFGPGMVDTNAEFYRDVGISYMGLPFVDDPLCNILQYSTIYCDFISDAITNGGKVLINCFRGRSRSPAIAIAFLRINLGMPVPMALKMCCQVRYTNPNDGFLAQLLNLEYCLNV